MLLTHFVGLVLVLGPGLVYLVLSGQTKKLNHSEAQNMFRNTLPIGKLPQIGLLLMVVSGGYLMGPHWEGLTENIKLIGKLTLVLVFGGLVGMTNARIKALKGDFTGPQMVKINNLRKITFIVGIIIVILAVLVFR